MKWSEIPKFTNDGNYKVNVSWDYIEHWISRHKIDLNPDFQRGHVWTEKQQIIYVEFCLKGGKHSNLIRFNCPGWMQDFRGPFVLVDGKQRLEAVRKFLCNELPVFGGHTITAFEDSLLLQRSNDFIFAVNDLTTRNEVLQWYIDINSGGTIHTPEEIEKVRKLIESGS